MCHLAGYIGNENAYPKIKESLSIQEAIIGSQATGFALLDKDKIILEKDIGPMKSFEERYHLENNNSTIGIGHTRYAIKSVLNAKTNTREKAHPFWNSNEKFVTMHNGTIYNYMDFINRLEESGYKFKSQSKYTNEKNEEVIDYCDSEVYSFLLEEELKKSDDIKKAIKNACKGLEGAFAFVILHPDYPENLFIANWMQPMHVGYSKDSSFFTSFEIGFEPVKNSFPWKFTPSMNSLITLSKGKVTVEPLLEKREITVYSCDEKKFSNNILEAVRENKKDLAELFMYILEQPEKFDLSEEEFTKLVTKEGYTFTPLIYETLEKLEKKNIVKRKLEFVWEGGIENTPRYKFYYNKK